MGRIDILLADMAVAGALALACILIWRRLYREFPFFLSYVISSILIALIRVAVSGNYQTFFKVYWATETIYALLALLALHEVFRLVFMAFFENWWFWLFFPCVVAAIFILAVVSRLGSPPVQANRVISLILSLGTAVNLVQALLFLLFFSLVWFFGIRWRNYPFGIVLGFAAIAIGVLGGNWARSEFGTKFNSLFGYAHSVAYIVAVILWLETFIRSPQPEPKWTYEITPEQLLEQIRQYTKIFERYFKRRRQK
jgi:hypothetical protein